MVKWVNENGGLNGHKVEPVWTPQEFTDTRSNSEKGAAACTQWTQDNKVVAGINTLAPNPNDLPRCLNAAGAAYVQWGWLLHTQAEYRQIPNMFNPGELNAELLARTYGDKLAGAGFFPKGAKVGLLVNDYPAAQEAKRILKSRLSAHGVPLDDANIYTIPQPAGWTAVTSALQALQNAQLKMRASGVTHVLFLCWGCASFFMVYADSQDWAPKYGFTSDDLVGAIPSTQPDLARRQLQGAMGVGWWPAADVGADHDPKAFNDTWRLCQKILKPTGETKTEGNKMTGGAYCAAFLFLQAAAKASGAAPLTGAALRAGAERLGTTFQDPMSMHTTLGPNKHAGVDRGRLFRFSDACACFKYDAKHFAIQ